jgi:hypothetical protein
MKQSKPWRELFGYGAVYFSATAIGVYFAYRILGALEHGGWPEWWCFIGVIVSAGGVTVSGQPFFAAWRAVFMGEGPISG